MRNTEWASLSVHIPSGDTMIALVLFACLSDKNNQDTNSNLSCSDVVVDSFPVAPDMPVTQIHPDAVFANEQVWIAYNVPDETGSFDVYLQAIACDGTILFGPHRVDTSAGLNETYPRLAVSGDSLLLVWQTDDGSSPHNLSINTQLWNTNGELVNDFTQWNPVLDGEPFQGNAWMPAIAPLPDGGFVLTGSLGLRSNGFSVVAQQISVTGDWVGNPLVVEEVTEGSQVRSAVGSDGTGDLLVAYEYGTPSSVRSAWLSLNGGLVVKEPASAAGTMEQGSPDVTTDWTGTPILSYHQVDSSINIYADRQMIGFSGSAHTPHAASGQGVSLLAGFRIQSGIENDLMLASIDANGTVSEPWVQAEDPPVAPYRAALTHLGSDVFFVAWVEGASPDFVIRGQFLDLAD